MSVSCVRLRPAWYVCVLLAFALASIAPARAQQQTDSVRAKAMTPPSDMRKGPYGSAGAAYGSAPVSATILGDPYSDTQVGFSFYLAAGVAVNPHLRVGGEFDRTPVTDLFSPPVVKGQNGGINFFSVAVAYYPSLTNNLWFKANLGWAKLQTNSSNSGASSESGLAGGIGAGYDLRLGESEYVVIPFANYFTQFSASNLDGFLQGEGNAKVSLFQIGVGIGYHH